jgi:mRNA interferase MazF
MSGDILLAALPQADGVVKLRPVLYVATMPPYGDLLVSGISSQTTNAVAGFDEIVDSHHPEFGPSGLKVDSVIRLGFLAVVSASRCRGRIGKLSVTLLAQLRGRLADFLRS